MVKQLESKSRASNESSHRHVGDAVIHFVLACGGVVFVVSGLRARPQANGKVVFGSGLIILVAVVIWVNIREQKALDLNPRISTSSLAGRWQDGRAELTLEPSGSYTCVGGGECARLGPEGSWSLSINGNIQFISKHLSGGVTQRVVLYRGKWRLTEEIQDPDTWNGHLSFEQL